MIGYATKAAFPHFQWSEQWNFVVCTEEQPKVLKPLYVGKKRLGMVGVSIRHRCSPSKVYRILLDQVYHQSQSDCRKEPGWSLLDPRSLNCLPTGWFRLICLALLFTSWKLKDGLGCPSESGQLSVWNAEVRALRRWYLFCRIAMRSFSTFTGTITLPGVSLTLFLGVESKVASKFTATAYSGLRGANGFAFSFRDL